MSKVRVNLANPQELLEIPGLAPEQASAIVRFRAEHGPIRDAVQLVQVLGGAALPVEAHDRLDFDPAEGTAPEAPGG
jgi:DNA uptake protein ComE-like DNA-binding protein